MLRPVSIVKRRMLWNCKSGFLDTPGEEKKDNHMFFWDFFFVLEISTEELHVLFSFRNLILKQFLYIAEITRHCFHKKGLGVGRSSILQRVVLVSSPDIVIFSKVQLFVHPRLCCINNELGSLKPEFRQENGWTEYSPRWILLCWKWFPGGIV